MSSSGGAQWYQNNGSCQKKFFSNKMIQGQDFNCTLMAYQQHILSFLLIIWVTIVVS